MLYEGGQNQRGTLRRCLQFAEANRSTGRRCFGSWDPTNITLSSHLPENPSYANILESSYLESSAISSNSQAVILSEPPTSQVPLCMVKSPEVHADKVDRSLRNNGNSLTTAPRPSGIGLHLNSIVNPTTMSSNATPRMKFTGKKISCAQRDTSAVEHHLFVKSSSSSLPTNFGVTFEVENNDYYQESQAIVMESPANFSSPQENADGLEENQLSPKNKRKKTSNIMENEGCKRCNCKRSKCLKLYCECFAAGIYCAEPCACQECFNKPEYKDMVLATRQQIESRNPLAFAPKIVRRVIESPADKVEEVSRMTPSSARHKRGCNCKKSMCLKKYCECFQKGRRTGVASKLLRKSGLYCIIRRYGENVYKLDIPEARSHVVNVILLTRFYSDIPLHPVTPAPDAALTSEIDEILDSRLDATGYVEFLLIFIGKSYQTPYDPYYVRLALDVLMDADVRDVKIPSALKKLEIYFSEVYREVAEMVYKRTESESREDQSYAKLDMMEERSSFIHPEKCHPHHLSPLTPSFQRSSHGKDVPKSRVPARRYLPSPESDPNLLSNMRSSKSLRHLNSPERRTTGDESKELIYYRDMELDQFSPKWDRLSDICDLTPTPHRPSKVTNSSSSSNTRENSKVSRVQMSCGSGSHSPLGSLLWRSSPIPPMPRLGGTKLQKDPDSEAMYEGLEDDTPEILKESFTPIKSVKASSPNQKRISPPHNHLHDLRSNSSPGLKSGRKFVLQSISSFPSLTPYSDPKFSSSSK
ncbi:hypothetical protein GIB67_021347 [Kingdonia uniflora]|uniref:CRC domain-containing protein n=1 Tax=Kingdonia uniflora TaxID=39325 RepID=A0A7J7MCU4_9MAGN|nr:hypothetical protein GIB67_021347 [Kingdonia uniflora]